ncbi:2-phospho-L-lactate guanylyltransferase [Streptomyces sp. JJ38]|uniref:2-phospho-L-lactate guanylyltransferase n=1 Tax=Streptomyces sp. JJ38 TaxID=2738128 RepID=UPI001C56401A|nr:2-phospho-L-lactate guanylyltransferase [Streptomyces sp. JJ38]MBW1598147.1 2-phospho-L-lactate guanylyltransferase [Streptomyces sp. JJ38]
MQQETREVAGARWSVVVPLKTLGLAKSRLAPTFDDDLRPRLALAFALDTVTAALACPGVWSVVVVTDDPLATRELTSLGARVLPDIPGAGLNPALRHGAERVRAQAPRTHLAALNADLPALRPAELGRVLAAAARFPRAFLADAAGVGTTLLTARPGVALAPAFGGESRRRHRASGAVELGVTGVDSVRRDVDTGADLGAALALGVGCHTLTASAMSPG